MAGQHPFEDVERKAFAQRVADGDVGAACQAQTLGSRQRRVQQQALTQDRPVSLDLAGHEIALEADEGQRELRGPGAPGLRRDDDQIAHHGPPVLISSHQSI